MDWHHRTNAQRLPGAADLFRYWDPIFEVQLVRILPGQFYVTRNDEALVTVLGSCISACIRDKSCGLGGMNHFMLPQRMQSGGDQRTGSPWDAAARYGNHAMELLINAIIKRGGERKNFEVKIFGGSKILASTRDIGALNIDFAREYLQIEGLPVFAEDLGGCHPRKIIYFPATGKAKVKHLSSLGIAALVHDEMSYRSKLNQSDFSGTMELFDSPETDS